MPPAWGRRRPSSGASSPRGAARDAFVGTPPGVGGAGGSGARGASGSVRRSEGGRRAVSLAGEGRRSGSADGWGAPGSDLRLGALGAPGMRTVASENGTSGGAGRWWYGTSVPHGGRSGVEGRAAPGGDRGGQLGPGQVAPCAWSRGSRGGPRREGAAGAPPEADGREGGARRAPQGGRSTYRGRGAWVALCPRRWAQVPPGLHLERAPQLPSSVEGRLARLGRAERRREESWCP